jgi:hypothetical protein
MRHANASTLPPGRSIRRRKRENAGFKRKSIKGYSGCDCGVFCGKFRYCPRSSEMCHGDDTCHHWTQRPVLAGVKVASRWRRKWLARTTNIGAPGACIGNAGK